MSTKESIVQKDLNEILNKLDKKIYALEGSTLAITGGAGFLGYYLILLILKANDNIFSNPCRVICIDNLIRGCPKWIEEIKHRQDFKLIERSAVDFEYETLGPINYIIHAASIASPTAYRQWPIETMDANILGLRRILEYCANDQFKSSLKSLLFFSSSEIYGDPDPKNIPTPESYWGNVSCTGPRACYDESKRFGETICLTFHKAKNIPIKIVRPFNNYGPGLSINDKRVIPDFCGSALRGEDIIMHSDGSPTRTFCYITDAITGYMLALLSEHNGEFFNIGTDKPEISMRNLAEKVISVAKELDHRQNLKVVCIQSADSDYLKDNPNRRCPSILKAKEMLGFNPTVTLEEGLHRTLNWYKQTTTV